MEVTKHMLFASLIMLLSLLPCSLCLQLVVDKTAATPSSFKTIKEALDQASHFKQAIVINIKKGIYREYVKVQQQNVTFIGDGIGNTIITGNRSPRTNFSTFDTATLAVEADFFGARSLTVQNTAGPNSGQAVALRLTSKFSYIYNCSIEGYQDTLYVHQGIQFFRECNVYGTVDFIFGDAAVVFQKCNILARSPGINQTNVITAQGRTSPATPSGIVIQDCKISASSSLGVGQGYPTYLGRPWKPYSRVVIMESFLDSNVPKAGWLEWNGGAVGLDTLFYAEFKNIGPGSVKNGSERVHWKGYHFLNNPKDLSFYTVSNFIDRNSWLSSTGVPFKAGL